MRLKPNDRRRMILQAACDLAREKCYLTITREQVAQGAGVSESLVNHYFKTMRDLRDAVIIEALVSVDLIIIGQGMAHGDLKVSETSETIKQQASKLLIERGI